MSRLVHVAAVVALLWTLQSVPLRARAAAQADLDMIDLAAVPVPPEDLPERGFQAMTGGFLDRDATAAEIAEPHADERDTAFGLLDEAGWERTYVLDLVLLADRANPESDIMALVRTNLFDFADEDGAAMAFDYLADFDANREAVSREPAVAGGVTVQIVTESGNTLRSLTRVGEVILEVISLESFRPVDPASHDSVVVMTTDRLIAAMGSDSSGVAPRALLIADGPDVADLVSAPGSGVHQLYRLRDGRVLPAAGELDPPASSEFALGLMELYLGSQALRTGSGAGFASTWIGTFGDEEQAAAFVATLPETASQTLLPDPYFRLWAQEDVVSKGVVGVYRVSGNANGERFGGTVEIRQHGARVVGIGWRTLGNAMPAVDATSRIMDAQLACLDLPMPCPPLPLATLMEPVSATPVVVVPEAEGEITSAEFGWSVSLDPSVWTVDERFSERGYDYVGMRSDRTLMTLESVVDQHGDPQQCVIDQLHDLQALEEHAVIDLGSDVAEEAPAGMERGHAWAMYTVEPLAEERADQEYTIRIDCYTLVEGAASLVVTQTAPRDLWLAERHKGDLVRGDIRLPATQTGATFAVERVYTWRCSDVMIDRIWIGFAA